MSDTKYIADLEKELPDLEIVRLRQEVAGLKKQLEVAQQILKENDLGDILPAIMSDEESICRKQIGLLRQLSDKGLPFASEDVKNLETLVKTLLAILGKQAPAEDKKPKKKKEEAKVADLLAIVKNSPKAE